MEPIKHVLKRDGSTEPFYPFKIEDAIAKAFKSVSVPLDENVVTEVLFSVLHEGIVVKRHAKMTT